MTRVEKEAALTRLPMPEGLTRMESGAVQFGDDFPGYFLRGDNAAQLLSGRELALGIVNTYDSRPSVSLWLESALGWIPPMRACIMGNDADGEECPLEHPAMQMIAEIVAAWDSNSPRQFDDAIAKAREILEAKP